MIHVSTVLRFVVKMFCINNRYAVTSVENSNDYGRAMKRNAAKNWASN